jgi:hypothetical protein
MRSKQVSIIAVLVGLIGLAAGYLWIGQNERPAAGFLCPELHSNTTGTALKETLEQLTSATEVLKGPDRENAILAIASNLKKTNPGVGNPEIVNYLLTAYCPIVETDTGLSADEKRAQMDRFSSQAYQILSAQ